MDHLVQAVDGRSLGVAEFGDPAGTAVLWCHGGPGSRLEPMWLDEAAAEAGLRLIGVDRPGYGRSDPQPGRTIVSVVADMLHVADRLTIDTFATVGVSTGGAYALALAALTPDRVIGVLACAAMTDMSWTPGRATMTQPHAHALWDATHRDEAIAAAVAAYGEHGSKMLDGGMDPVLADLDKDLFADPAWMGPTMASFPEMFACGVQGYADDRIADGPGWIDFDVAEIRCPVVVLHGTEDKLVDVIQAKHTAGIVPGAQLVLVEGHGHFSIEALVIPQLTRVLRATHSSPTPEKVELREVTEDNLHEVLAVTITTDQEPFVGSVADALAEAEETPEGSPWYRAVYLNDEPVGFVMLSWNVPPDPPRIIGPWFLWKLIVDERHQRHGVGRRIVEAVADIVRDEGAAELLTSYSSGDGNPGGFYRRLGFVATGDVDDHGETIVSLDLLGGGTKIRTDTPGSTRE